MSALTDSFPLSHITNHFLSTYPVFKAIFSPDGRNVACIKVKPHSHTYRSTHLMKSPSSTLCFCVYLHLIKKPPFCKDCLKHLHGTHTAKFLTVTSDMTHLVTSNKHPCIMAIYLQTASCAILVFALCSGESYAHHHFFCLCCL